MTKCALEIYAYSMLYTKESEREREWKGNLFISDKEVRNISTVSESSGSFSIGKWSVWVKHTLKNNLNFFLVTMSDSCLFLSGSVKSA